MAAQLAKGIELVHESPGDGPEAGKGVLVTYCARFFLRQGDEVTQDGKLIAAYGSRLNTRFIDGVELIEHKTTLGSREPIAGVEKSLLGMRQGGFREVLVGSHLAYGNQGLPGIIPPNAMLRIKLWLRNVVP